MYVCTERKLGWCRWERDWGEEASYTNISEGPVAVRCFGDVEYIGVRGADYYDYEWNDYADEGMVISDEHYVENSY